MADQQQATLPLLTERLRSSCDACGTAKVKCDRGQPQCHRCAGMGLNCVYGVTRKSGKPPRKRLAYAKRTPPAMPTPTHDAGDPAFLHPGPSNLFVPPSGVRPSDLMMTDIAIQPTIVNGVDDHTSLKPSFFLPQYSPMSLENWNLDLGLNLSSFIPANTIPDESQGISPATSSVPVKHNCPVESYEVFRDLTMVSALSEEKADTILAQLDKVLQVNRKAIDRLSRLLECSCFKPPYLVMLHSSIISRILDLYQQAAGCAHTVRHSPAVETAETIAAGISPASSKTTPASSTSNMETQTSGISDEVAQLPFSLGKFNIEEPCVQFAFKNLLIGNELKRAGNLIGLFASQSPGDDGEGLRKSLSAWLRADHSSTVRILRSAIKELNDGINL